MRWHHEELDACPDAASRLHRLSHLNVRQQVGILSRTLIERVVEGVDSEEHAKALPKNQVNGRCER